MRQLTGFFIFAGITIFIGLSLLIIYVTNEIGRRYFPQGNSEIVFFGFIGLSVLLLVVTHKLASKYLAHEYARVSSEEDNFNIKGKGKEKKRKSKKEKTKKKRDKSKTIEENSQSVKEKELEQLEPNSAKLEQITVHKDIKTDKTPGSVVNDIEKNLNEAEKLNDVIVSETKDTSVGDVQETNETKDDVTLDIIEKEIEKYLEATDIMESSHDSHTVVSDILTEITLSEITISTEGIYREIAKLNDEEILKNVSVTETLSKDSIKDTEGNNVPKEGHVINLDKAMSNVSTDTTKKENVKKRLKLPSMDYSRWSLTSTEENPRSIFDTSIQLELLFELNKDPTIIFGCVLSISGLSFSDKDKDPDEICFHIKMLPNKKIRTKTKWRDAVGECAFTFALGPFKNELSPDSAVCIKLYGRKKALGSRPKCFGDSCVSVSYILDSETGIYETIEPLSSATYSSDSERD